MEALAVQAAAQAVKSVVPAVDAGKCIFNRLKRKYGYVRNINKNFAELEKEGEYLCADENDVKTILDRKRLTMEKTHRCEIWLDDVVKLKQKIRDLKVEYNNVRQVFCGLCPFPTLVKLGKKIVETTTEASSLKKQIDQIKIMVEKAPAPFVRKVPKKIDEFPSLNKHVQRLQECLRNVELKRIWLWGAVGIGKTTIMENLHDVVGDSWQFDIIFWVTLSTNGNVRDKEEVIRDIQEVIVERLDLKAEERTSGQRAHIISEELKNKSYVLFLDGASEGIDLRKVGIHDENKHGKVVFASRQRNFTDQTDEDINVQRLSNEDAQKLFWNIVGLRLKDNRDIKPVAKLIVNECGGLLHVVQLIGTSLAKEENPAIWRHTLSQLRSPTMEPKQELEEVYRSFKLVCDKLDSYKRLCLLYWAIFPAGYEIHQDYIIECWRAEQFFPTLGKLGEARDSGLSILKEFFGKSLLERGSKGAHYKMFEYFQRVALRIANHADNSCKILVKEREKIRDEEWEQAKNRERISLVGSFLSTLPESPECCRILTLLLQESNLVEFPISFFVFMCSLQLLDLHDTKIRSLPSSISRLKKLKVLFLNNCRQLMQLPAEVGDLCSLEILDIRQTGIHSLPAEIGQLTDLKCLRVSFVEDVGTSHNHVEAGPSDNHVEAGPRDIIAPNIIAKLESLEELGIDVDPQNGRWNHTVASIVTEVALLEKLSSLRFYFPDVDCFQTFVDECRSLNGNNTEEDNNFRSFSIQVGHHQSRSPLAEFDVSGCSAEKHLRFSAGEGFPPAILEILKHTYAFELIGHRGATSLSDLGCESRDILEGLEACIVEECNKMTSIVDGDSTGGEAFQCLKQLHLKSLPNLEHIWKGSSIPPKSFTLLTTLTLKGCHGVKTLFSVKMVLQFKLLQCLQIEDCKEIDQIIEDGDTDESRAFPELKILELCCLPKLSKICHDKSSDWPSLETAIIKTCEALINFPSTFENAAKLSIIKCTQACWDRLNWPNDEVKNRFQSYHQLIY